MSTVAVLGAGAGGLSTVVDLLEAGHDVRLWSKRAPALAPSGTLRLRHTGVAGEGSVDVPLVSAQLAAVVSGADLVVVSLPAPAHAILFGELVGMAAVPMVLSPGDTGGALHLRRVCRDRGAALPPVAELSTLPYVARVQPDGTVQTTMRAQHVRGAALPGGGEALALASALLPGVTAAEDVLETSLANVNLVLHPPGAVLAGAWVEATRGDFTFYRDAMTPGVTRVLDALDRERLAVAAALGHDLPPLREEMALIGTVPESVAAQGDTGAAIRAGDANSAIKGPDSLDHRYYREDFPFALAPFLALAAVAGAEAPMATALWTVGVGLLGADRLAVRLDAAAMGIDGLDASSLLKLVHG